ncbi:unnamed protein product [Arabidopsis thaliana]|uniref:Uncharacterized protein n=1 Tax=Arabidopsis thaliana TaxID=3702 RepID=A0A654E6V9_ARATH|nr:unnamed protein product [Arabidopsis thaliana]
MHLRGGRFGQVCLFTYYSHYAPLRALGVFKTLGEVRNLTKGGSNLSDKGLNLSGSWQQGHSATYNTPSRFYPPLGGNYNSRRSERRFRRTDLANDTCLWEPKLLLRVGNRAAGACVASSPDSDLEAFSHNPAHGSFAPLAFQPAR